MKLIKGHKIITIAKNPPPPIWKKSHCRYHKNFELRPSETVIIESDAPNHARLIVKHPSDGIYQAVITNEFGIATRETRVLAEFPFDAADEEALIDTPSYEIIGPKKATPDEQIRLEVAGKEKADTPLKV